MIKPDNIQTDWSRMPKGLTWYFIGPPKTGKTTVASEWSERGRAGTLILDADLGTDFVDGCNRITITSLNPPTRNKTIGDKPAIDKNGLPIIEVVPPEERGFVYRVGDNAGKPMPVYSLAEVVADLLTDYDSYKIDTVVLDTVDVINEWIETEIAPEGMGKTGYGADWAKSRKKNKDIVSKLQRLIQKHGGTLILISHSKKTTEVDGKVQLAPELPSGLASNICAKAEVIGYTTIKKNGEFTISFAGYDEKSIGSRLRPLRGKEFPFNYEAIKKAITGYIEEKE